MLHPRNETFYYCHRVSKILILGIFRTPIEEKRLHDSRTMEKQNVSPHPGFVSKTCTAHCSSSITKTPVY
jgi:hypothetical protein